MRRNIWLASLVGVLLGSWLTLVAVQVEEHGSGSANRAAAESPPAARAPTPAETAKAAGPATTASVQQPADTTQREAMLAAETKPDDKGSVQPAAAERTPPAATPTATLEGPAKALVATTAEQIGKDQSAAGVQPAILPESKTSAELAEPNATRGHPSETQVAQATPTSPAPSDQTKADQTPTSQMPADQTDREQAAAAHRTASAAPPSQQASGSDQKPSDQTKPVELVRPFADRAGILTVGGKSVQLPGIIPTDTDRTCTGPNGKSWPCGAAARTAFRMYLRGRTVDCDLPNPNWQGTVTGACRYVRVDLSEWLVRFGWAEPEPGSPLVTLAEQAKQQKRGIYGDDPRAGRKSTLGPPPAKENPLNPI
ncbi:thermonuclease family protein [Rhizobium sp. BR 362]|uniref:thermonuclease family protein n=1 Tax=Rhizobium sp. BR 362 TaxID=3040670 RepID=UPI002F3F97F3